LIPRSLPSRKGARRKSSPQRSPLKLSSMTDPEGPDASDLGASRGEGKTDMYRPSSFHRGGHASCANLRHLRSPGCSVPRRPTPSCLVASLPRCLVAFPSIFAIRSSIFSLRGFVPRSFSFIRYSTLAIPRVPQRDIREKRICETKPFAISPLPNKIQTYPPNSESTQARNQCQAAQPARSGPGLAQPTRPRLRRFLGSPATRSPSPVLTKTARPVR